MSEIPDDVMSDTNELVERLRYGICALLNQPSTEGGKDEGR
jgi:hypothetical protein